MNEKLTLGIVAILAVMLFGMFSVCMITADIECANSQDLAEDWIHQSNCDNQIATAVSAKATAIEATKVDQREPDNIATAYAHYNNLDLYYEEAIELADIYIEDFLKTPSPEADTPTPTAEPELPPIPTETEVPNEV